MKRTIACAVVALSACLVVPERAGACGPMYNLAPFPGEQALTGGEPDVTPPAKPVVAAAGVEGQDEEGGCGPLAASGKCGGPAVVVDLEPPDEPEGQIGWRFRVVKGQAPREDFVPDHPVVSEYGGTTFSFGYPGEEPFDFTLEVTAIDAAGNESAPATVRIADGGDGEGCAAAGAGRSLPWLVLVGVLAVRRRAR